MLALDERYLTEVKAILLQHVAGYPVWAYGSRVTGGAHAGSDLDLVIIDTDSPLDAEKFMALKSAFSESNLPILIDISLWSTLPESYQSSIKKAHFSLS